MYQATQTKQSAIINQSTSVSELTNIINNHIQPVDYEPIFQNHRTVFFGENHAAFSFKHEIEDQLQTFKNSGLTHLALEMFAASFQDTIDEFQKSGNNRKDIESFLHENWELVRKGASKEYMSLVDVANDIGLKIIGLDYTNKELIELNPDSQHTTRNKLWAKVLDNILTNDPESKILIYNGSAHSNYIKSFKNQANSLLTNYGHDSYVINFAGGLIHFPENCSKWESVWDMRTKLTKAAHDANLDQEIFSIFMDPTKTREADMYIHLPQVDPYIFTREPLK